MTKPTSVALVFPQGAEEPIRFYREVFRDAETLHEHRSPDGKHVATNLRIRGTEFILISGGPDCTFSMASSFMIFCDTQEEIDYYWAALGEGGTEYACGWLSDRFGVTWQVTPSKYGDWVTLGTPEQAEAAFQTLISQTKIDIAAIEAAWQAAGPSG